MTFGFLQDWDAKRAQITDDVKRQLGVPIRTNVQSLSQSPEDKVQVFEIVP